MDLQCPSRSLPQVLHQSLHPKKNLHFQTSVPSYIILLPILMKMQETSKTFKNYGTNEVLKITSTGTDGKLPGLVMMQ